MLEKNRDNIAKALPGLAKYQLTQGETVANGAYYNAFVPNLISGAAPAAVPGLRVRVPARCRTPASRRTTPVRAPNFRSPSTAFRSQETCPTMETPVNRNRKRLVTIAAVALAVAPGGGRGVPGAPGVLRTEDDHRLLPVRHGDLSRRRGPGVGRQGRHHRLDRHPRARRRR